MSNVPWPEISKLALDAARAPLKQLEGDVSDQARELAAAYEALYRLVDQFQSAMSVSQLEQLDKLAHIAAFEDVIKRRQSYLASAALAYAGSDAANAFNAGLNVAITIIVAVAKRLVLG